MNNKRLGTEFERETCDKLSKLGYWVHFIAPDLATGKQPFDIIAVLENVAIAIDCKTCVDHIFRLSRAEDNQILAFEKWLMCGNDGAYFLVKHEGKAYLVPFRDVRDEGKVLLEECEVLFECNS